MNENEGKFTVVKSKHHNYQKLENDVKNLQRKIHSPKVDLISSDNSFKVRIELPGVRKDTIRVQIKEQQIVLISGIKNTEFTENSNEEESNHKVIYSETKYGNFIRRIKLPELIEPFYFNSKAYDLYDGVLYLEFQKQSLNVTVTETVTETVNKQTIDFNQENINQENVNWSDLI